MVSRLVRHLPAFSAVASLFVPPASAVDSIPTPPYTGPLGLYNVVCDLANWFFAFALVIAVITFLLGAYKFFTSEGNETKVSEAKKLIFYAIIGVAVALLAKGIVLIIGNLLGVTVTFFGRCQ